jgi:hypothetical protein
MVPVELLVVGLVVCRECGQGWRRRKAIKCGEKRFFQNFFHFFAAGKPHKNRKIKPRENSIFRFPNNSLPDAPAGSGDEAREACARVLAITVCEGQTNTSRYTRNLLNFRLQSPSSDRAAIMADQEHDDSVHQIDVQSRHPSIPPPLSLDHGFFLSLLTDQLPLALP